MSSVKTGNNKLQSSTVLLGENGLPISTIPTLSSSIRIVTNTTDALIYSAGVVTVPVGTDLNPVRYHKSKYTGRLILHTADDQVYFIDRVSVNDSAKTFSIYTTIEQTAYPVSIDLSAGWIIAEAEVVNRLATTSSAKIDSLEFRDMHFSLELDGDPVTVRGKTSDHTLEPNSDGSVNIVTLNGALETTQQQILTELEMLNAAYTQVLPVLANATFLQNANFDQVIPSVVSNTASLSYKEDGYEIAKVDIYFTSRSDWALSSYRYLVDDDGTHLTDDDGSDFLLE